MRSTHWFMVGALGLLAGAAVQAAEGDGLVSRGELLAPSRFQGRLSVGVVTPAWRSDTLGADGSGLKVGAVSLLGDYYFSRNYGHDGDASGFRATSGLLLGSRLGGLSGLAPGALTSGPFSVGRRSFGLLSAAPGTDAALADSNTVPYFGIGYTGASLKGALSFTADVGLVAMSPGSAVRLGRVLGGTQSLDEVLRDLRLSPVLQLGVSYSF